jgi:YggT family protein
MSSLQYVIQLIFRIFSFVIIIDVFLSFLLPPNNPFRLALDKIVQPLLRPIQRVIPPIANLDFSPIVLLILLQVLEYILIRLF